MDWEIRQGDALETLKTLPDQLIQCCVTSPPYWGLRDYGVSGQLGLEKTPDEYVAKMVEVFREVRRVLRDDGVCWINLGDSYARDPGKGIKFQSGSTTYMTNQQTNEGNRGMDIPEGIKPKDIIGIPWMTAFALRADGWYLRSDIIWHKPNPMPESVTDRPTKAHEYIFLLSKNQKYFYDADAIREPHKIESLERWRPGSKWDGERVRGYPSGAKHSMVPGQMCHARGRNKRTVWTVPTKPFSGAHFATFPPDMIEPCILAGTSPQACPKCGAPWERVIEKTGHVNSREDAHVPNNTPNKTDRSTDIFQPTCKCPDNDGTGKCIVLDPFSGSGTTGLVALRHGRRYLGVELNLAYIEMSRRRIEDDMPLFNSSRQTH
jgi:DNA modification methylase